MISCKALYCINKTEKTLDHVMPKVLCFQFPNPKPERVQAEILLNNISSGYNISTYKMMLSPNYTEARIVILMLKLIGSDLTSNSKLMSNMSHDLFITPNIFILLSYLLRTHFLLFFTSLFINNIF